jgi:catechol 2,3-dioxygenase-like lactoylglutathione lyase family enzyme
MSETAWPDEPRLVSLATVEIKAFVPALDLERSKAFYLALGFEIPWSSEDLAYVRFGCTSFLLQAFNHPRFVSDFQMHLLVENVADWYAHVLASGIVERFGVRVEAPQDQLWAMRDFPLFDPSGVLWRVAQNGENPHGQGG